VAKFQFLNVSIDNVDFGDFVKNLESGFVVTPNVDHLIKLQKDLRFYNSYQAADHIVCDSKILMKLSKFLDKHNPITSQIAGSVLFPAYCEYHKNNTENIRIFLLGGTPETVQIEKDNMNARTSSHILITGYSPTFAFVSAEIEWTEIIV